MLGMKIKVGNVAIKFLGRFTLETYLVHPLFIQIFGFAFMRDDAKPVLYIQNQFLYVLAVTAISVPIAFLFNKVLRKLKK